MGGANPRPSEGLRIAKNEQFRSVRGDRSNVRDIGKLTNYRCTV